MGLFSRDSIPELAEKRDFDKLVHLARKPKTREEALAALDRLRDPAMIEPTVEKWDDMRTGIEDQQGLAEVLRNIGTDTVVPRLVELAPTKPFAIDILVDLLGAEALPILRELAFRRATPGEDSDIEVHRPFVQERSFRGAFLVGTPEARRLVLDGFADEDTQERALAATISAWEDDDPDLLEIVVRIASEDGPRNEDGEPKMGHPLWKANRCIEGWAQGVIKPKTGEEGKLAKVKAETFEKYDGDAGIARLAELLRDTSPEVQVWAIRGLFLACGEKDRRPEPDPRMADALAALAGDSEANPYVRVRAVLALDHQNDPRGGELGLAALEAAVAADHDEAGRAMAKQLRRWHAGERIDGFDARVQALIDREEGSRYSNDLKHELKALAERIELKDNWSEAKQAYREAKAEAEAKQKG